MRKISLTTLLAATQLIFMTQCEVKNSQKIDSKIDDGLVEDFSLEKTNDLNYEDWRIYSVMNDKVYIPKDWKISNQEQFYPFSRIDSTDKNSFFVISKYDTSFHKITVKDYIYQSYKDAKNDPNEALVSYTLKKMSHVNRVSYYAEYETSIKGHKYITRSTIIPIEKYLFDFAVKERLSEKVSNLSNYQYVLQNTQISGRNLFDIHDRLVKITDVDPITLEVIQPTLE